ncbi:MAG: cytochrome b N-terminal domain-containing protein [Desulfobulbaceae bacterium]|nr:cytochrome b N-terminal domain-containing protein [Desulfobulbaceae bacterium]
MVDTQSKGQSRKSITDFLVHIHPPTVPEETLRLSLSWGLGGMAAMLVFLLVTTGILQLLTYEASTTGAYASVQAMYSQVPLGGWVRNIHHWSANILVIIVILHLLRVFLTGAIGIGRRLNWIIGLVLLFLVLFANFSGYLLPWDQLAYWAVTISTSMLGYYPGIGTWMMELFRGGADVRAATLANFYGLHIAVIPFSLGLFMIWHFWLVRKSGGLVRAKTEGDPPVRRVPAVPDLIVREAAVGLGLVAVVMLISVIWNAPLLEQANPGMSPNPAKAPWYFVGFQELLLHLHPVLAICVVPVLASILLLFLPFWQGAVLPAGTWFGSKRGRGLALRAFSAGILLTSILVGVDEMLIRTYAGGKGMAETVSRGYLSAAVCAFTLIGGYQLLIRKWRFSRAEAVMAGMSLWFAVFVALTVIGVWFRGQGMQLTWP